MNTIKQHHRLLALVLSVLLLVGMIPMSVLSASAAEVDAAGTGGISYQSIDGYTDPAGLSIVTTPVGKITYQADSPSGVVTYERSCEPWTVDTDGSLVTGDPGDTGNFYRVLKITASQDGVLKLKYRVNANWNNSSMVLYFTKSATELTAQQVCTQGNYDSAAYYKVGTSLYKQDLLNAGLTGYTGKNEWYDFAKPVEAGSIYYFTYYTASNSSNVGYYDNKAWIKDIELVSRGDDSSSTFYYDVTKGNVTTANTAYSASATNPLTITGKVGEMGKAYYRFTNATTTYAYKNQFAAAVVYKANDSGEPTGDPIKIINSATAGSAMTSYSRIFEIPFEELASGKSTNNYYVDFVDYAPVKGYTNNAATNGYTVFTRPGGARNTSSFYYDWTYDSADKSFNVSILNRKISNYAYLEFVADVAGELSFDYDITLANSSCYLNYAKKLITDDDYTKTPKKTATGTGTISGIQLKSGDIYRIGLYQPSNAPSVSTAKISNITFTPLVETTIEFTAENNGKFTASDGLTAAAVTSDTGVAGTTKTYYVVPDYDNGYKLTGVYDSNNALVEPVKEDFSSLGLGVFYYPRQYEFTFPQSGSLSYTAKFEKMTKQTFDVKLPEGISYVMLTQKAAYADTLTPLTVSNALPLLLEDGDTFEAYPGDRFEVSMIMDSEHLIKGYKAFSDTVTQINPRYDATQNYKFNVTANSTGGTLELLTDAMPAYEPVEDYTDPANVTVTTRGSDSWQHKTGVNSNVITTHPWTADANGVLTSGTASSGNNYSFLSVVADRDGQLSFDYKISTNTGNYMLYKVGHTDPDLYSGLADNYNVRYDYCSEVDWTTYSATVSAGDEIRILYYRASSSTPIGDDCVRIRDISLVYDADITIDASDFDLGTINYNYTGLAQEEELTASDTITVPGGSEVTVTAYPTAYGQFVRWEDEDGNKLSTSAVYTFNATRIMTVKAIFTDACDAEDAIVAINNTVLYGDFDQAIDEAAQGDYIVLLQDFEIDHDVTIPTGVTLLVPFDDAHHLYTTHLQGHPALAQGETPDDYNCEYAGGINYTVPSVYTCYCKLTVADGVTVTVNGSISLSAKNVAAFNQNSRVCPVDGAYSQLDLQGNSKVVLNSGSNLYAWGYVTGTGSVVANSGSHVYEYFQFYDFRGGSNSLSLYLDGSNQFPFNQYYIQNIEAPITYKYGATEYVNTAVYASSMITVAGPIVFIGENGLFQLKDNNTRLERHFVPAEDKMYYDIYGDTTLDSIKLGIMGVSLASDMFYLPINDIDITVHNGGSLSTDKDVVMLPGSGLNIESGATLNINKGTKTVSENGVPKQVASGHLVFAGSGIQEYSANGGTIRYPARAVPFAASEGWTPRVGASDSAAQDYCVSNPAVLNNNGTVNVADGAALVCTEDGAQIDSSLGSGVFNFAGDSDDVVLHRFVKQSSTDVDDSANTSLTPVQTESALLRDVTSDDFSTEGARWADDIDAHYTKKNGEWGDWREVNFVGSDEYIPLFTTPLGTQLVNVTDKDSVTDYNALVDPKADFDTDGKYWKYVEKGKWTYDEDPIMDLMDPSVSHLVAYPVLETTSVFEKHSLTLNGDVGVNFYVFDAPAGATMSYSWGNKYISDNNYSDTESYTATDTIESDDDTGYKLASVSVAPKEIGDEITVNMLLDGNVIATETYSAATYLNTIINDRDKALAVCENSSTKADALQALCTSMLQYGAACQMQFGYKTDALFSDSYAGVTPDLSGLTASYYDNYPKTNDTTIPRFTFMGYMMTLDSESVLNLVFRNDTADEYPAFTYSGVTPVRLSEGKYYRFDVTGIKIAELLDNKTVTINDTDMTVNAGTYIYLALQQNNATLQTTMKNLYNYYLKATAYFEFA